MPIIDHIVITVANFERSRAFYEAALAPLGIRLVKSWGQGGGFGALNTNKPDFWIGEGAMDFVTEEQAKVNTPIHVAFAADTREAVDAFHAAAIAAGGRDHGKPGKRDYHPNYYGAFVLDPDGHNVEAVCHKPN